MKSYLMEINFKKRWNIKEILEVESFEEKHSKKMREKHGDDNWAILEDAFGMQTYYFPMRDKLYQMTYDSSTGFIGFNEALKFKFDVTGVGAFNIMAKVIALVQDHSKRFGKDTYKFAAVREEDEKGKRGDQTTRAKLYIQAIKSVAPSATVKQVDVDEDSSYIEFKL